MGRFHQNLSGLYIRLRKSSKLSGLLNRASKNLLGCQEMTYGTVGDHLSSEAWCKVAYGYTGLYLLISRAFIPIYAFPLNRNFLQPFCAVEEHLRLHSEQETVGRCCKHDDVEC
jgi:hypothetical protein